MAQMVLVIGESGTGKSTSLRNCDPATTAIVNPVGKPLPFKGKFDMLNNETDASKIIRYMKDQVRAGKKLIAIDDFQYMLAVPYMNRIKEQGWDKYNDFGANYFDLIKACKDLPDDVIVVYFSHLETLENGLTTVKLIGKLLREKITIEGLFTIVLRTGCHEAKYYFYTQNSGKDTVKSPMGMFPIYAIDNDMAYVADKIRNYYELDGAKSDADIAQADAAVAAPGVEKPTTRTRSRSSSKRENAQATDEPKQEPKQAETTNTTPTTETTPTGRTRRSRTQTDKTHEEVLAENKEKVSDYVQAQADAIDAATGGSEEGIPFDEAEKVIENIPKPEIETPPRRRRERSQVCVANTYFYISGEDNYVLKHAGDPIPVGSEVITKEAFQEGVKRLAQAGNVTPGINPPADAQESSTEPTGRSRRVRARR